MKKLENKGSATVVLLAILIIVAVGGVGYYVWNKNQNKETTTTTSSTAATPETTPSGGIVTIPANFKENTAKANELKTKSNTTGLEYQYYVDLDTATIITVMSRPVTTKDSGTASINANAEATTMAKVEFPSATKEIAKAVAVKGDGAEGYLVEVSNSANKAYVSYIGAANSEKVVLVSVRTVEAYKTQQQEVVKSLLSSIQL